MSPTGTRVVPTLTEVLDEQRLGRSATGLSTEAWPGQRASQEDLVPISLDWGDEPSAPASEAAEPGDVMTPWQVVPPRDPAASLGDVHFIDLSIDVAPVQPPPLHAQVLDVYAQPSESLDSLPAVLDGFATPETPPAADAGAPDAPFRFGDAEAEAASLKPLSLDDLARAYPQHTVAAALQSLRAFDSTLPLLAETGSDLALDLSAEAPLSAAPEAISMQQGAVAPDAEEGLPALLAVAQPDLDRLLQSPAQRAVSTPAAVIADELVHRPTPVANAEPIDAAVEESVGAPPEEPSEPPFEPPFEDTVEEFEKAFGNACDDGAEGSVEPSPGMAARVLSGPVVREAPQVLPDPPGGHAVATPQAAASAPGVVIPSPVDPGTLAVRQGHGAAHGVSEERLQAIVDKALDRLLRDELPSALVETLIRLSPQLSESLIESLKPSLHLHVMEALAREPLGAAEPRAGDPLRRP